jgi:lipopolysaccharide assembly protein A
MKIISYIFILLILILGVSFAILNADPVNVHYYIGIKQMPLSLLLVISFGLGAIMGLLVMGFNVLRLKTKNIRLNKKLKVVEKEIANLRVIPVKE